VGELVEQEQVRRARLKSAWLPVPDQGPEFMTRELFKVGNRDLNHSDFTWVVGDWLTAQSRPAALMTLERREWGYCYGDLVNVEDGGRLVAVGG
ncbi:phosphate ABC transporter, permease protein PstA, partial [Pseudomonas syringae pv. tagetis]